MSPMRKIVICDYGLYKYIFILFDIKPIITATVAFSVAMSDEQELNHHIKFLSNQDLSS